MQWIPNLQTRGGCVLLYRILRRRKGFGVHSPFVYNLITKVIEEKCSYYCFYDIELVRRQLYYRETFFPWIDRRREKQPAKLAIGEIVRREAVGKKQGALLFRLANYFKPKHILQVGGSVGLSTLYLTAYSPDVACVVLENMPSLAAVAREVWKKGARVPIDLRVGPYNTLLSAALQQMERLDFVFFNRLEASDDREALVDACIEKACSETVIVMSGIQANPTMRAFWRSVCARPEVTVTLDLYTMGIVLFNRKLHKRDYTVYF